MTTEREPMLSIYSSHDRELLFHGDVETARARGIRIKGAYVTLNGEQRKIVNHDLRRGGDLAVWITG